MPEADSSMKLSLANEKADNGGNKIWKKGEKRLWLISLWAGSAFVYASRTILPVCIVSISAEFNWDKTESGAVLSAFFWGYTMTQIIGGYLSDRVGGDLVMMTAAVGWALITFWTPPLAYVFNSKSVTLTAIILSRVLVGCFQGVHFPAMTSLICQGISPEERSFRFSLAGSGAPLGTLFSGSVGSILLSRYGWQCPFYVIGLLSMAWLLFIRYYLIPNHRRKTRILSVKDNITGKSESSSTNDPVPWATLFTKPPFWAIIIGHFCMNNAFFILLSWLPTYFQENFPDAKGWVFNVVPWIVIIPTGIFSGWLADFMLSKGISTTIVRKIMTTISLFGVGVFLKVITYTSSYHGALLCMTLALACNGFHSSGLIVNPQDIAPKYSGSVFGLMNTAGAIPGFIGVYVAGHILEITKSWAAVFNITSAGCIFGWTVYLIFGTGKKIV